MEALAELCALVMALGLFGCGGVSSSQPDGDEPEAPPAQDKPDVGLGDKIDISLADWLKLPRAELAAKVRELKKLALAQQQSARDDHNQLWALLPQLYPPFVVPVIQDSNWSEARGISEPTWLAPGTKDADLALHLARHGDVDAALVVAPDDAGLRQKLEALRSGPNIPFEWSQLVGIQIYLAQVRVAQGEADGATELVLLHRQLLAVLPPPVQQGALGTALLPLGRRTLGEAARAWHSPSNSRPLLAGDIDKAMSAVERQAADGPAPPDARPSRSALAGRAGQRPDGGLLERPGARIEPSTCWLCPSFPKAWTAS